MDAIKFVKTLQRKIKNENRNEIIIRSTDDANFLVDLVEKWSKEYPIKTRQGVFLEQFPNVRIDINNIIDISPCRVDQKQYPLNSKNCCKFMSCSECRRKFWMQEVE